MRTYEIARTALVITTLILVSFLSVGNAAGTSHHAEITLLEVGK